MRILALLDLSDDTAPVVKSATALARGLGASLLLLHVATPDADCEPECDDPAQRPPDLSRTGLAAELRRRQRVLHLLAVERGKLGVDTTARVVRSTSARGSPAAKILKELAQLNPDYVVIGSHGHGPVHEMVLGSVSRAVVRRSVCPVLVVPNLTRPARPPRHTSADLRP